MGAWAASASPIEVQPAVLMETPTPLPPYDCNVMYDQRETAWTQPWKDWCCENKNRACDSSDATPSKAKEQDKSEEEEQSKKEEPGKADEQEKPKEKEHVLKA